MKNDNKVTNEMVAQWLGTSNQREEAIDVIQEIANGTYTPKMLLQDITEYYDQILQPREYDDTSAPLEAQFYFYPRYNYSSVFDVPKEIIHNDFRKGQFYIYDIDWGDGTPKEFKEPKKLGTTQIV